MASSGAALVVHDLKNQLGALEAALQQLALQPAADAAAAAHRQCRHLRQRLVMYLAAYGADGELRAVRDDESPAELLQSAARRHGDGHVTVSVEDSTAMPTVWYFDRRLVAMALDAALHNALRFARHHVVLAARAEGGQLLLSVDDDGPGLSPEAAAGDSQAAHNTGLGTTLCRAVARAHGVADGVQLANRPGGGARFVLRLAT